MPEYSIGSDPDGKIEIITNLITGDNIKDLSKASIIAYNATTLISAGDAEKAIKILERVIPGRVAERFVNAVQNKARTAKVIFQKKPDGEIHIKTENLPHLSE
jgi:hypothetical protein